MQAAIVARETPTLMSQSPLTVAPTLQLCDASAQKALAVHPPIDRAQLAATKPDPNAKFFAVNASIAKTVVHVKMATAVACMLFTP